jgi:hypothetical protein
MSDSEESNLPAPQALEAVRNAFIVEGLSAIDLSKKFNLPVPVVESIITEGRLNELRIAYIKHGLAELQNIQLSQAEKLMNLDNQFKRMRIIQIETQLQDYVGYFAKHGHFYKIHPITGEILNDVNGIPMQIKIPNLSHEISALKEAFTLSEGLKQALAQIDDIINKPKDVEKLDSNVIDADFNDLFAKKPRDGE